MSAGSLVGWRDRMTHRQAFKGPTLAAAFTYNEMDQIPRSQTSPSYPGVHSLSPRRRAAQVAGMNGYNASTDLPPPLYVRALYDYEADDTTSLSFRQGDIIQVITQLESGWWDGIIQETRGWFPSNYCAIIDPDDPNDLNGHDESEISEQSGTEEEEYEEEDDSDANTQDDDSDLPIEGAGSQGQDEASGFWIPQATPDGRLFYFNTRTGVSSMELPLETPSINGDSPPDSSNFHIPAQTRPPPEMMAGGYHHEEDYDGSSSEVENERSTRSKKPSISSSHIGATMAPIGTTATSFSVPTNGQPQKSAMPRHFTDEAVSLAPGWESLIDNMRAAVDSYRASIHRDDRAEYVRRAEDISDHLRMILAAGSGTTDNHSGNPSIISTNKALYPHFREMMSKFSKLVLSSHIAAADWPGPESGAKCLQEADGVMHGVYGYVEVARQQRGEEIPRLVPGFVSGSLRGGNWQDNNIDSQFMADSNSFIERSDDENRSKLFTPLDKLALQKIEQARLVVLSGIRRLESYTQYNQKIVTPARQAEVGDSICTSCGALIEHFRSWIALIESLDLAPLGNVFQKPNLLEFSTHKQRVYDSIGELIAVCQATTAPLPDEWAEVRGESLDTRLAAVRAVCKQLEEHISRVNYAIQLLESELFMGLGAGGKKDHRMTAPTDTLQSNVQRMKERPQLGNIGQSVSYTVGQDPSEIKRHPKKDKASAFFGAVPPGAFGDENEQGRVADDHPWFLQMEHENEVQRDHRTDLPQVKSGTLAGLVEQLTRHDRPDPTFNATFLLTYRSFISAAELFQFLVRRFNTQPPPNMNREEMLVWEEQKQKPVRFRVVNILKTWIEHYWMESNDMESLQLLERTNAFARNTVTNAKIPGGAPLATVIEQRIKGQDTSAKKLVLTLTGNAPTPILPKNMKKLKFDAIDPLEFARQLTIVESRLYGRIKPVECLEKIWERKEHDETGGRAPNVRALILHSNQVTNCVAEMILNNTEVKKRVGVVKRFVEIADKCRTLNNFSSLTAIVSALGTAPILRLNRTWAQLPNKTKELLENMRTLIASTKNFSRYREALREAQPPCIPFLGVYLTDLTFIEDGIASVVKNNTELINFTKRTKTAEVIRDIQQYQNVPYTLTEVPELRDWILDNMRQASDVHEMYNKSLQIEPREREEEKIARLLSESGFL
ncbi:cell division cycle-related protein [Exophiala xenobiotica]|uniref:Cell division cycle-related protein n=1 Tax=Lithohypha guttulata TaxID=1690604 RepID=A0ABR0K1L7_9EURO|nr:cell division cycle-related protein [Lithohypha guttulata]KAK5311694.1 cell division cycle-related protein [Exophiala xenobiotica]